MDSSRRQEWIVERLRERDRVEVAALARELATSEVTVRRDLDVLEQSGVLRRVHGGAVSTLLRGEELPFALRETESADAKARIARRAVELVQDGEAVTVDSGTTGLALARVLAHRRVTAVPLSLPGAVALAAQTLGGGPTLVFPGGTMRPGEGSWTGPMTEASLRSLRVDTALLTCCGLSLADGVTAHDVAEAAVKQAAMAGARRTVLVAEAAKFSRVALAVVCAVGAVDVVVTDTDAPVGAVQQLRDAGVEVLCA